MSNAYMKEWLLLQLKKVGKPFLHPPKEEAPTQVKQTLLEAGYLASIPSDDIPVAYLPGMLRLDKTSWLNCLSVDASFSSDVEDGDLVVPVATSTSDDFSANCAVTRDAVWKPFNSGAGTVPTSTYKIWGVAYSHIGKVLFGPIVFHQSFAFSTGTLLYAGASGKLTSTTNNYFVGACVSPGFLMIKQF